SPASPQGPRISRLMATLAGESQAIRRVGTGRIWIQGSAANTPRTTSAPGGKSGQPVFKKTKHAIAATATSINTMAGCSLAPKANTEHAAIRARRNCAVFMAPEILLAGAATPPQQGIGCLMPD